MLWRWELEAEAGSMKTNAQGGWPVLSTCSSWPQRQNVSIASKPGRTRQGNQIGNGPPG
jgi:hypothetical protein